MNYFIKKHAKFYMNRVIPSKSTPMPFQWSPYCLVTQMNKSELYFLGITDLNSAATKTNFSIETDNGIGLKITDISWTKLRFQRFVVMMLLLAWVYWFKRRPLASKSRSWHTICYFTHLYRVCQTFPDSEKNDITFTSGNGFRPIFQNYKIILLFSTISS